MPQPVYINYDAKQGLPSSEIYCGLQDKQGYLWFATDRGVSKFNGYEFKTFTTNDGLINNVVFKLYEDHKGRIWVVDMNGGICYFEGNKITPYKYNDRLAKLLPINPCSYSFHIDESDNLYYGTSGNGLIIISKNGTLRSTQNKKQTIHFSEHNGKFLSSRLISHFTNSSDDTGNYTYQDKIISSNKEETGLIRSEIVRLTEELICFTQAYSVVVFNVETLEIEDEISFPKRITSLNYSVTGEIFVGVEHYGLHILGFKNHKLIPKYWTLKNTTVTGCFKDREEGYWITTIQRGLYYTPNFNILAYTKATGLKSNYIKELGVFNQQLYISYGDSMQELQRNIFSAPVVMTVINNNSYEISDPAIKSEGCYLLNRNQILVNLCSGLIYPNRRSSGIPVVKLNQNSYYIFTKISGLKFSNNKSSQINLNKSIGTLQDVEIINDSSFWIGGTKGLFKKEGGQTIEMAKINRHFSKRIVDLDRSDGYELIVATRGSGIILMNQNTILQINRDNGLISNDITCVHVDSLQNIWVATNSGLNKIDALDPHKIEYYSIADGLPSNEITDVKRIRDLLYVGTKRGLAVIELDGFKRMAPIIKVRILEILLNGIKQNPAASIDIYSGDKYLGVHYLALIPGVQGKIEYKYRIKGLSNEWQYTKNRSIKIETFPQSGLYTIEIYARVLSSQKWGTTPAILELKFHPPFYKTWTFIIGLISIILLLVYTAFKVDLLVYNKQIQQEITNRILKLMRKKSYLIIELNKEIIRIDEDRILYIQSFKDYLEINTPQKKYVYRCTMKNMESRLPSTHFIRVHRSYIVRKDKIDGVSKDYLILRGGKIPIGKTYRALLKGIQNQFSRLNI
jgi:ligand-binding sensor domain-containing protein